MLLRFYGYNLIFGVRSLLKLKWSSQVANKLWSSVQIQIFLVTGWKSGDNQGKDPNADKRQQQDDFQCFLMKVVTIPVQAGTKLKENQRDKNQR